MPDQDWREQAKRQERMAVAGMAAVAIGVFLALYLIGLWLL